jgi:DNA-directed RNA polymerase specialized sigma24 family protein
VTLHGGGDHGLSRNQRVKRLEGMEEHQARMRSAGEVHAELRPLLFSIAYRMLGSVAEAEDVVQEAFLRWHRALEGGTGVESPKAYLAAVTTRLAIARGARLGAHVRLAELNGQPGAISLDAQGRVINVFVLDVSEGRVQAVRSVVNPDKLGHLGPVSDVARLDRPARS